MLTLQHAKALQGKFSLPPSSDLFLLAAFTGLASKRPVRIHPVADTPVFKAWAALLEGHASVNREADACTISPGLGDTADAIVFPDDHIPYRDLVVFLALSTRKRVVFRSIGRKRLDFWRDQAKRVGCPVETISSDIGPGLILARESSETPPPSMIDEQDIHAALGLFFGLRAKRSFQIDFTLSTPFRHIIRQFGYELGVKRDIGEAEKDPIIRRMRLQARQRLSSQDQLFTITADFSVAPVAVDGPVDIVLPGDEVLLALILLAKSLVHKGSLVVDNAPLEQWAAPLLTLVRKMGGKPSPQETHQTSFGGAGMLSVQRFDRTGQKTDFVPHFHYAFQLPAMAVLAAFAEGESLFRKFDDLRRSDPDEIKQLESCLRVMQVKFGDIPDGFVIKGDAEHDGFDLIEPLPAHLAGAFAVAGLHCAGSTTINEEHLLERWPDFHEMIEKLFEFRTEK